jgi:hypothetical protein
MTPRNDWVDWSVALIAIVCALCALLVVAWGEAPTCHTDTECMEMNGGDGGPEPKVTT